MTEVLEPYPRYKPEVTSDRALSDGLLEALKMIVLDDTPKGSKNVKPGAALKIEVGLPDDFPTVLEGPMVWEGDDHPDKTKDYICELSAQDIVDIEEALRQFKDLSPGYSQVSTVTFPLPKELSARLKQISEIVHSGRGFQVLRGLDPKKYTDDENLILFTGLSVHVAGQLWDNTCHLYDAAGMVPPDEARPTNLSIPMSFHSDVDQGDVIALCHRSVADEGGGQYLSSSWKIYNEISRDSPEIIETLFKNWPWENKDPITGKPIITNRPIFSSIENKLRVDFAKTFLIGSPYIPRASTSPVLSPAQTRALTTLLDNARKHAIKLDPVAGDMVFVNNLSIMHARDAFVDNEENGKVRYLFRLCLRDRERSWETSGTTPKTTDVHD